MPSTTRTLDCKHLSPVWWFSQAVAYQKPVGASNTCEETDALKRRHQWVQDRWEQIKPYRLICVESCPTLMATGTATFIPPPRPAVVGQRLNRVRKKSFVS